MDIRDNLHADSEDNKVPKQDEPPDPAEPSTGISNVVRKVGDWHRLRRQVDKGVSWRQHPKGERNYAILHLLNPSL